MILTYFFLINFLTFVLFGMDKRAARRGQWRIPEGSLLFMCLIGGSLGGLFGQRHFRHKTKKASFVARLWFLIFVQAGVLIYLFFIK